LVTVPFDWTYFREYGPKPLLLLLQGFAFTLLALGLTMAIVAPAVLAIEVGEWLTSSEWPVFTVSDGLGMFGLERETPETDADRFVDTLLAVPFSVALFLTGVFAALTGLNIGDWGAGLPLPTPFAGCRTGPRPRRCGARRVELRQLGYEAGFWSGLTLLCGLPLLLLVRVTVPL